jgi:hypothetical protein
MEYIINSTSQENEVIITNVTMILNSGSTITLDIPHFLPKSFDEINQNIINRSITEQIKLDSFNNLSNIISQIPINQTITT